MLLVWGFKARYKIIESGMFACPHEGVDRGFSKKEAKRWFTFFWIPILPLNALGEFVECDSCKSSYDPRVLTNPTTAQIMDNLANAVRYAVVAIINADGVVNDLEKKRGLEIMQQYSDTPYTQQHLDEDIKTLPSAGLAVQLSTLAGSLNEHGKETLLNACVDLAVADGSVDAAEMKEIQQAGVGLGMTQAHVRGVLATATDRLGA